MNSGGRLISIADHAGETLTSLCASAVQPAGSSWSYDSVNLPNDSIPFQIMLPQYKQALLNHNSWVFAWALLVFLPAGYTDEPVPEGLPAAITDPAIPGILDVTITGYNDQGHAAITVNKIYKSEEVENGNAWSPPKKIRGYGYVGSDNVAPFKTIAGGIHNRFLIFVDGDLLYSTYNNRFPIRKGANGTIEVGVGFNGGGGPWLPLTEVVKKIPLSKHFQRDYIQAAKLTESEEHTVLELARQCGITNVAKITTQYRLPSTIRYITVESAETVSGRAVSSQLLEIKYKKWLPQTVGPRESETQVGDFWAGQLRIRKQTILKVGPKEYRTASISGITIQECETILDYLLEGNYKLAAGRSDRLDQVDWSKPKGFYKRGDTISVSFPHKQKGEGLFELHLQQTTPKLTINEVMQMVP